eukprot:67310-Chlamydomonas_euryale.AAC.2
MRKGKQTWGRPQPFFSACSSGPEHGGHRKQSVERSSWVVCQASKAKPWQEECAGDLVVRDGRGETRDAGFPSGAAVALGVGFSTRSTKTEVVLLAVLPPGSATTTNPLCRQSLGMLPGGSSGWRAASALASLARGGRCSSSAAE